MIPIPKIKLIEFCKSKGIKNLSLFGSALTSEFNAKSDIDLLAEFKQENIPTLFELVDLIRLSELFNGRKIDLRTKGDLSEHVRKNVIKNIFPIYENMT